MTALSLFDGMSCAQIATQRAKWKVTKYLASEIDTHAIKVTQANYPDTIQLGNVTEIDPDSLPWIDSLFAGSPCQGFSKAGKGLNFDDPRSGLFWHFVRIKNALQKKNPNLIWLLENVDMIQEWEDIISKAVGIMPVKINSSLVSAQNRVRLYWTNIGAKRDLFGHLVPGIEQPKDLGLTLKDILEDEVDERYYISKAAIDRLKSRHEHYRPQINPRKTGTVLSGNQSGKNTDNGTTYICHSGYGRTGGKKQGGTGSRIRRLTPIECERLQGVPDNYTAHVSDTQRYKMLGNGWQIDTIVHILKHHKQ